MDFASMDLSDREKEVLDFLIEGMTDKEIGTCMGITVDTVKVHFRTIRAKARTKWLTRVKLALAWHEYRRINPATPEELIDREASAVAAGLA